MNDIKLLEMAAKAARRSGLELLRSPDGVFRDCTDMHPSQNIFSAKPWRPLEDDGDAMRLLISMEMTVGFLIQYTLWQANFNDYKSKMAHSVEDPDLKRAIVSLAAHIGKAMP